MERFRKIISDLNNFNLNGEQEKVNELLQVLSKEKRFREIYETITSIDKALIKLIVPYKVSHKNNLYMLKEEKELSDDYSTFILEMDKFLANEVISQSKFNYIKENVELMGKTFFKEFQSTELDKLDNINKSKYYLYKEKINNIYYTYVTNLDLIRKNERMFEIGGESEKLHVMYDACKYVGKNANLKNLGVVFLQGKPWDLGINKREVIEMNLYDLEKYPFRVLLLEEIYKAVCCKLLIKKEDVKIIKALIEELEFIKSGSEIKGKDDRYSYKR